MEPHGEISVPLCDPSEDRVSEGIVRELKHGEDLSEAVDGDSLFRGRLL